MSIARIYLNDVEVGSLPKSQYDQIVSSAKKDYRLYILQLGILLRGAVKFTVSCFRMVPAALLFYLSVMLVFSPDDVIESVALLNNYTVAEIVNASRILFLYLWTGLIVVVPSVLIIFRKQAFGIYNCFDNKINNEIRRLLEVPAEGNIEIICYEIANEES